MHQPVITTLICDPMNMKKGGNTSHGLSSQSITELPNQQSVKAFSFCSNCWAFFFFEVKMI